MFVNAYALRSRRARVLPRAFIMCAAALLAGACLICAATLRSSAGESAAGAPGQPVAGILITVAPGDTLWSIARAHYGESVDARKAVYCLRRVNGLRSPIIHPGQSLFAPVDL